MTDMSLQIESVKTKLAQFGPSLYQSEGSSAGIARSAASQDTPVFSHESQRNDLVKEFTVEYLPSISEN